MNHVGPVEAVHTVDPEDPLLLTDNSGLVHPDRVQNVCVNINVNSGPLRVCYKWRSARHSPGPLHVSDDVRNSIGQSLHILKLHTSTEKEEEQQRGSEGAVERRSCKVHERW